MKKTIAAVICTAVLCTGLGTFFAESDDPLVTLSYIKEVLMPEIDEKIESSETASSKFEVVNVKKGEKVICENGTELILRMGSADVIATEKGGLADVTHGFDIPDGEAVPSNSHLIVPFSDGRGVVAKTDAIFLIKGEYKIK